MARKVLNMEYEIKHTIHWENEVIHAVDAGTGEMLGIMTFIYCEDIGQEDGDNS